MARVTWTPINFLLFRGQMIKVVSQILRKARASGYIVPAKKVEATEDKFEGLDLDLWGELVLQASCAAHQRAAAA